MSKATEYWLIGMIFLLCVSGSPEQSMLSIIANAVCLVIGVVYLAASLLTAMTGESK